MKQSTIRKASIGLIIVAAGVFAGSYLLKAGTPPADFLEARIKAIGASNSLAQMVEASLGNLQKVDSYVKNNEDKQAMTLITYEYNQREQKQTAAVTLAAHLDQMAKTAPTIESSRARGYAMQAITSGIAMVSRMISYNSNLDILFEAVETKITTGQAGPEARALITELNNDASVINTLNTEFNTLLGKFDRVYGIE